MSQKHLTLYLVTTGMGLSGEKLANTVAGQFPEAHIDIQICSHVNAESLEGIGARPLVAGLEGGPGRFGQGRARPGAAPRVAAAVGSVLQGVRVPSGNGRCDVPLCDGGALCAARALCEK